MLMTQRVGKTVCCKELINIKVDSLAKKALMAAHSTGKCIQSAFPNEQIWISMEGKKVTGSLRIKLEEIWDQSTAKSFSTKKELSHPKTFCTFITKQVSGWCGCNSKLSLWEENIINKCPLC
jgi:hypothetical protein